METVIVERTFEQPIDMQALQAAGKRGHWCMELHNVEYVRSYVSADSRRVICVYRAPDAESVRLANTKANMPFDRVWTASLFTSPES